MIWTEIEKKLSRFTHVINNVHPSIKFTLQYSIKKTNYLDITIYIKNQKLCTKVFHKLYFEIGHLKNSHLEIGHLGPKLIDEYIVFIGASLFPVKYKYI